MRSDLFREEKIKDFNCCEGNSSPMKKNCILWLFLAAVCVLSASEIVLAEKGKTRYSILIPEKPQDATRLAAQTLRKVLKAKTGAEFSVVSKPVKDGKYIVLEKAPEKKLFSGKKQMSDLKEDEYVFCSQDKNIYLYGEGIHGAFNAAVDFMENHLGWRWFSVYDKPVIPKADTIKLNDFYTVRRFLFPYRMRTASEFVFFHGCNMRIQEKNDFSLRRYGRYYYNPLIKSKKFWPVMVHSCLQYIPPFKPKAQSLKGDFRESWLPKWDYEKTNPDFFAMQTNGSRKPFLHLCWSNKELRKVFLEVLEKQFAVTGEDVIITIDTGDDAITGPTCICSNCQVLREKYKSLSGPHLDFVLEVARLYKTKHPKALINTELFRRDPKKGGRYEMPDFGGKKLPDNIILGAANKEFINRPIDHPDCKDFYERLKSIRRLTKNVYLWSYPQPFSLTELIPFSNLHIQIENLKKVKDYVNIHFDETGAESRLTFNQLQLYVILHLIRNPAADPEQLIREYTDGRYGPAAELVRAYQKELEEACCNWKYGISYDYSVPDFDTTFGYLTPERMLRWQKMFDQMTELVKGDREKSRAVKYLRLSLDYSTLATWIRNRKHAPDYFKDPQAVADRFFKNRQEVRPWSSVFAAETKRVKDMLFKISLYGQEKPLPAPFDKLPSADVIRLMPNNHRGTKAVPEIVGDKDAAFGYAATVHKPDLPFCFGIYYSDLKQNGPRLSLEEDDLPVGKYKVIKLGETIITRDTLFWFSGRSWLTSCNLGGYWDSNNTTQKWIAYASLKFPENYQGKDKDIVLCDQIILVKKNASGKKK